jgi:hypothetical protein
MHTHHPNTQAIDLPQEQQQNVEPVTSINFFYDDEERVPRLYPHPPPRTNRREGSPHHCYCISKPPLLSNAALRQRQCNLPLSPLFLPSPLPLLLPKVINSPSRSHSNKQFDGPSVIDGSTDSLLPNPSLSSFFKTSTPLFLLPWLSSSSSNSYELHGLDPPASPQLRSIVLD